MQVVSPARRGNQHFQKDFQQIEAWSTVNPLAESHDDFGLHKEIEDQSRPQAPADGNHHRQIITEYKSFTLDFKNLEFCAFQLFLWALGP